MGRPRPQKKNSKNSNDSDNSKTQLSEKEKRQQELDRKEEIWRNILIAETQREEYRQKILRYFYFALFFSISCSTFVVFFGLPFKVFPDEKEVANRKICEAFVNENSDDPIKKQEMRLCQWLQDECDMDLSGIYIADEMTYSFIDDVDQKLRGVFTNQKIDNNVLTDTCLPTKCMFSPSKVRPQLFNSESIKSIADTIFSVDLTGYDTRQERLNTMVMAVSLAEEYVMDEESFWHPYLSMLPGIAETMSESPLLYGNKLPGTEDFQPLIGGFPGMLESTEALFKQYRDDEENYDDRVEIEHIAWALHMIVTRTHNNERDKTDTPILTPLLDFANNGPGSYKPFTRATQQYFSSQSTKTRSAIKLVYSRQNERQLEKACFISRRKIKEHEALQNDYDLHMKTPYSFFLQYGFIYPRKFHLLNAHHGSEAKFICGNLFSQWKEFGKWLAPGFEAVSGGQDKWVKFYKLMCPDLKRQAEKNPYEISAEEIKRDQELHDEVNQFFAPQQQPMNLSEKDKLNMEEDVDLPPGEEF